MMLSCVSLKPFSQMKHSLLEAKDGNVNLQYRLNVIMEAEKSML